MKWYKVLCPLMPKGKGKGKCRFV